MAWNEPGGNGGKDPWGNRRRDKGPPDLDEAVKKMLDKFGGVFGSKGRGSSGNMPTSKSIAGILGILIIALLGWLAYDIAYIIHPAERGVVLRFGKFVDILQPGLNFRLPRPIERVITVNVDHVRKVSHKARMLTKDINIIQIELAVQ